MREPCWPALVPADLFERVNSRIKRTVGNGTRRPRSQDGQYLFAGAIRWERAALQDESFAARHGAGARARLQLYEAGQPFHDK